VTVRVDNDDVPRATPFLPGTGRGLIGLRERVLDLGGTFSAGPAPAGGWTVQADLASGPLPVPAERGAGRSAGRT
jgi:hypothetical protein